jgi:PAS domain S-box-containing protein
LLSLFASTLAVHIERARIQFQLVQERTLLRNTIDSIPDLIYFKDLTGAFVGANAAFARFYGKPLEQIIGRGSAAVDPPELVKRIQDEDRKVMDTGEIMRLDMMIRAGDGVPAPMVLVKSPLYSDKQEVIGLIGVAHDVSEFKRIEGALRIAKDTAEQATMAKSQFLANMSHEIRTPMNAIIGMSTLLGSTALSAEQQEYVDTIRSSGDSLLQLIDEILDYSKIEAGRMHVDPRAFDIHQLMRDTLHMFTAAARQRYNQMELIVGPTVPATIVTDDKRLRQILVNLIGNAVKFTERGLIRVLVAGGVTNDLVELHFAVQDTGIGIPPDRVSRLFESFYQVDSTSARRYSGTGLGLAISKRLADLLGGKMWVESTLGRGSTFHFTVQATLAGSQQEVVRKAAITLPPRPIDQISKLRMLLVEDNAVNQRVAVRILERLGYRTDVAVNGREAVEQVRAKDFDVILMDVQMPEMDGLEATRRIRSMFPPGVPQPNIVALTADATSGDRERCLLAGMDEYLSKPLRVDELAAILARYEQRLTVAKK